MKSPAVHIIIGALYRSQKLIEESMSAEYQIEAEKFSQFLESRGLRKTSERFEILKCALKEEAHFDADQLHGMLEEEGFHVSRATVYSTLELLCRAGIVRKLLFDTHQARYELAGEVHTHLVCVKCGDITEVDMPGFELSLEDMDLGGFSPSYVSTCLYGVCRKCQEKETSKKKE